MNLVRLPQFNHGIPVARLAAGLGPFNPYDVPETAFWFSPRHAVTLASGDVSSWSTQYPSVAFTAANAAAGQRPLLDATGLNGAESFLYTAANSDNLRSTTQNLFTAGATRYVLAVGKQSDAGGGCLMRCKLNSPACLFYIFATGGTTYYYSDAGAATASEPTAGAPDFTAPFLIEWELTVGAPAVVRVNGTARTLTSSNVTSDTGTATGFTIGGADVAGQYFPGHIADIYGATGIPSAGDKAKLRTHFAALNGITL